MRREPGQQTHGLPAIDCQQLLPLLYLHEKLILATYPSSPYFGVDFKLNMRSVILFATCSPAKFAYSAFFPAQVRQRKTYFYTIEQKKCSSLSTFYSQSSPRRQVIARGTGDFFNSEVVQRDFERSVWCT